MIRETWARIFRAKALGSRKDLTEADRKKMNLWLDVKIREYRNSREKIARILIGTPRFVNEREQPLHMIPPLKLDPASLEKPLYR